MIVEVRTITRPIDDLAVDVLERLLDKNKLSGEERMAVHVALDRLRGEQLPLPENVPNGLAWRGEAR